MLRDGYSVSETAYASGFDDVSYFRNCFKEEFGMSPKQYAKGGRRRQTTPKQWGGGHYALTPAQGRARTTTT